MRVVVDHSDPVKFPFIFKSAVRAGKREKPFLGHFHRNIQQICHSDGGERVGYIMVAGHRQGNVVCMRSVPDQVKRDMSIFVISDIIGTVVKICG